MSEEEKKAIERIEDIFYQDLGKGINKFQKITLYEDNITDIRKLLNLIENQQKEIEEKSTIIMAGAEKVKQLEKEIEDLNEIKQQICNEELISQDYVKDNFIAKDKIRELIKKYRILNNGQIEGLYNKEILALQELLEEK